MSARNLSCQELIEFLAAYVEAELPAAECAAFEVHLARCPDCVDYLVSYRETIRLGRLAFETEPPADVPDELIQAILAARKRA